MSLKIFLLEILQFQVSFRIFLFELSFSLFFLKFLFNAHYVCFMLSYVDFFVYQKCQICTINHKVLKFRSKMPESLDLYLKLLQLLSDQSESLDLHMCQSKFDISNWTPRRVAWRHNFSQHYWEWRLRHAEHHKDFAQKSIRKQILILLTLLNLNLPIKQQKTVNQFKYYYD